jgi:hypothetical protein
VLPYFKRYQASSTLNSNGQTPTYLGDFQADVGEQRRHRRNRGAAAT